MTLHIVLVDMWMPSVTNILFMPSCVRLLSQPLISLTLFSNFDLFLGLGLFFLEKSA